MPQHDPFAQYQRTLTSPADRHFAITPADGVDLPVRPRVLRVLAGGTLSLRDGSDTVITYGVATGETLLLSPVGVEATGTSAIVVGWL